MYLEVDINSLISFRIMRKVCCSNGQRHCPAPTCIREISVCRCQTGYRQGYFEMNVFTSDWKKK